MIKRIVTAVVGLPLFILIVNAGGLVYRIAVAAVLAVGCYEFVRMAAAKGYKPLTHLAFAYLAAELVPSVVNQSHGVVDVRLAFIVAALLWSLVRYPYRSLADAAITTCGIIYIVGLGRYFLLLRSQGYWFVFFAFLIAWGYDTSAYFVGLTLGKRRPWKLLSPKKSLEGVIGGVVGSTILALLMSAYLKWPLLPVAVFAPAAAFAGQLGDLIESSMKRHFEVKDSGNIMPGHGGVLDRFDGVLLVAPLVYYFVQYYVV